MIGLAIEETANSISAIYRVFNLRLAAATFSSRCATFDVPGMGSITGERCSSHASESWATRGRVAGGDPAERLRRGVVGLEQFAAGDRIPGQEADAVPLAIIRAFPHDAGRPDCIDSGQ